MPPSLAFWDPSLDRLPPTQTFQILSEFERNSAHIYSQVSPPFPNSYRTEVLCCSLQKSDRAVTSKVVPMTPPALASSFFLSPAPVPTVVPKGGEEEAGHRKIHGEWAGGGKRVESFPPDTVPIGGGFWCLLSSIKGTDNFFQYSVFSLLRAHLKPL